MKHVAAQVRQFRILLWLILSIGCILTGCETQASTTLPEHNAVPEIAEQNLVDTIIAVSRSISESFVCTGKIRCTDQRQISSLVGGRILDLNLVPGAYCQSNALAASLDRSLSEIELEEASLNLRLAQQRLEDLQAARPDGDSVNASIISRWELTAGIPSAHLQLKKASLNYEASSIRIPESGWVGEVKVKAGQQIFPGSDLADFFPDRALEAELYLIDLPAALQIGASVLVSLPGQDQEMKGRVRSFLPEVNEDGFVVAYVSLPPQRIRLLPGQAVTARIENLAGLPLPMIPTEAVLRRGGREVAFLYRKGLAEWTYVETGTRHGDMVQIREGISAGDTILTAGHQQLGHGAAVQIAARNRDQP